MGYIISILVDIIFGPFLWLSARKLRKNSEWQETQEKIIELTKKADSFGVAADRAHEKYKKMMADKALKTKNSKRS